MAKANEVKIQGKPIVKKSSKQSVVWKFPMAKQNVMILAIGVGVILLGYALMAIGITNEPAHVTGKWNNTLSVDVAPIVLVIGYCFIIPYGIYKVYSDKSESE